MYIKSEALNPRLASAASAYPGFLSMKRLGVFLLPLDGMLVHRRSLPRSLYSWVERGTVRVKCLAQEHNTMSPARAEPLEPGPFAPGTNALTIRPLRLHDVHMMHGSLVNKISASQLMQM